MIHSLTSGIYKTKPGQALRTSDTAFKISYSFEIISNAENIISLGAGRALTAVTIAKLFNRQIVVTDLEENLPLIEESCELNEGMHSNPLASKHESIVLS